MDVIDVEMMMDKRPEDLKGKTIRVDTACGSMFVTINSTINKPIFEVFAYSGKSGSCSAAVVDALTRIISIALRSGTDPELIIEQIDHIGCPKSSVNKNSCPEGIAEAMQKYLDEEFEEIIIEIEEEIMDYEKLNTQDSEKDNNSQFEECPECGQKTLGSGEGCGVCLNCGYSPCK